MINIYLDTSHLQKWQQRKLLAEEIEFLDSLKNLKNVRFVLSFTHIDEISSREDKNKAIALGQFLDNINKIWIRNPYDLICAELKYAIRKFKLPQTIPIDPYVKNYVDTLEPNDSGFVARLFQRNKSVSDIFKILFANGSIKSEKEFRERFSAKTDIWAPENHAIAKNLTKKKWNEKLELNFAERLKEHITTFKLCDDLFRPLTINPNDFYTWIKSKRGYIPSIWFTYCLQYYKHKNSAKWGSGDLGDLSHIAALPYLDFLTVDTSMLSLTTQMYKFLEPRNSCVGENKLFSTIKELSKKFNAIETALK